MFEIFYRAATINLTEMSSIVSSMDRLLDALAPDGFPRNSRPPIADWLGRIPVHEVIPKPSQSAMLRLCKSLVAGQMQRTDVKRDRFASDYEWGGSWYVGPLPIDEADVGNFCREYGFNDYFKDFVVTPTVLAVSILTHAMVEYNDLTPAVSGFEESLKLGFDCVAGQLRVGGGRTGLDALLRLNSGGALDFIAAHPWFSPPMHAKLVEVIAVARGRGVKSHSSLAVTAEIVMILKRF